MTHVHHNTLRIHTMYRAPHDNVLLKIWRWSSWALQMMVAPAQQRQVPQNWRVWTSSDVQSHLHLWQLSIGAGELVNVLWVAQM